MPIKKNQKLKRTVRKPLIDCALHVACYGVKLNIPTEEVDDLPGLINRAKDAGHKVTMKSTCVIIDGVRPNVFPDVLDSDEDYFDEIAEEL